MNTTIKEHEKLVEILEILYRLAESPILDKHSVNVANYAAETLGKLLEGKRE